MRYGKKIEKKGQALRAAFYTWHRLLSVRAGAAASLSLCTPAVSGRFCFAVSALLLTVFAGEAQAAALPVAQAVPPGSITAAWILGGLLFVLTGMNQAMGLWQKVSKGLKVDPPPAQTYRTRADCTAIHEKDRNWIRSVEQESHRSLDQHFRELNSKLDALDDKIMERIDPLIRQIAENRQAINQHLSDERAKKGGI